jgi:hypothetical protein
VPPGFGRAAEFWVPRRRLWPRLSCLVGPPQRRPPALATRS